MAKKRKNAIAASRLPDLPNAGYATNREKELSDEMMIFLRDAERDRLFLLSMVCDGQEKFRRVMMKAWRHLKADAEIADAVFGYLVLLAGEYPQMQLNELLTMNQMSSVQKIRHITGMERRH